MKIAKVQTERTVQNVVLTTDQLNQVSADFMKDHLDIFKDFYLRLGGMHQLMSYMVPSEHYCLTVAFWQSN